jgi:hypothetical protein
MNQARKLSAPAALGFLAALIAGCGSGDAASEGPATAIPASAVFYAEATVRPDDETAATLEELAGRVAPIDDPGAFAIAQIDSFFADEEVDLSYAEDIEPWLGEKAGFALVSPTEDESYIFAVETTDEAATRETLDKIAAATPETEQEASSDDVEYLQTEDGTAVGVTDGLLLLATEANFQAALDAISGDSLADSETYTSELDALADDPLATAYADPGAAIEASIASGETSPEDEEQTRALLGDAIDQPLVAAVTVASDSVGIEASAGEVPGFPASASPLLEELPGDSWFAAALPDIGTTIANTLDQFASLGSLSEMSITPDELGEQLESETGLDLEQTLGQIGDLGVYVRGAGIDELDLGAILELTDTTAAGELLSTLQQAAQQQPGSGVGPPLDPAADGFSVDVDDSDEIRLVNVEVTEGRIEVEAAADRQVAETEPAGALSEDPGFQSAKDALGDDFGVGFYLAAAEAIQFALTTGAADDPDYASAKPFLDQLGYLIAGSRSEDGRILSRVVLGLAD